MCVRRCDPGWADPDRDGAGRARAVHQVGSTRTGRWYVRDRVRLDCVALFLLCVSGELKDCVETWQRGCDGFEYGIR